jgi:tRNA nucleotidyltransferase/poly(A) polymerase
LRTYKHRSFSIAYFKIFGQEIDICKIPIKNTRSSDLEDDARLRDFTINSLYYSIDNKQIIDPTGRGLNDLTRGVIKACSQNSLFDDPIRIFRAIHISAKYNFEISESIKDQIDDYEDFVPFLTPINPQRLSH